MMRLLLIVIAIFSTFVSYSQSADLVISNEISNESPNVGSNITYTITVKNTGPDEATNTVVTDVLPSGYTIVSASSPVGSPPNLSWIVGDLANGADATLTIVATVNASGSYVNTASVVSGISDPFTTDNQSSKTASPIPTSVSIQESSNASEPSTNGEFKVVLSAAIANDLVVNLGYSGTATYGSDYSNAPLSVTINAGLTEALNPTPIEVIDDAVAESSESVVLSIISTDNSNISADPTTKTVTINDDDTKTISLAGFTAAETNSAQSHNFVATMSGIAQDDVVLSFSTSNSSATAGSDYTSQTSVNYTILAGQTTVNIPVEVLGDLISEPSESFSGTIIISNVNGQPVTIAFGGGTATATINDDDTKTISLAGFTAAETNSTLSQNFVATMSGMAQDDVVLSFLTSNGTAISGSDYTSQTSINYTIVAGQTSVDIPVVVLGDLISEPTETFTGTISISNVNGQPVTIAVGGGSSIATITDDDLTDLSIVKNIDDTTPNVGSSATFTLTVTNLGSKTALNVVVTDNIPSGYAVESVTPSGSTSWIAPTWTIGTLNGGEVANLNVVATVLASGTYNNTASVTSDTTDPVGTNNSSTVTVNPVPQADLRIEKSMDNSSPKIDDDVKFTVKVTNNGPSNATGVSVLDKLPDGYSYKSHSGDGSYVSGTGIWTVGSLVKDASKTIEIIGTVVLGTNHTNTATVSATQSDPVLTNNTASVAPGLQNSAPVAVNDSYSTLEDNNLIVNAATGLLNNDYDIDGQGILVTGYSVNSANYFPGQTAGLPQGSLTINANGSFTFSPVLNYNGILPSITYTISDGSLTANALATIKVTAVNDAPNAVVDSYSNAEDTQFIVNEINGLLKNDSDLDGVNISVTKFTINSTDYNAGQTASFSQGSLTIFANGSLTFIPALNFNGNVSGISYTISDGSLSASASISFTVTAVNDAPVANPDYIYTAQNVGTQYNVLSNDNDLADGASGGIEPNSLKITKQPTNGTIIILPNKNISYTPFTGFFGQDEAEYEICDKGFPLPALCTTGKIFIDVVRLSPLAVDDVANTDEDIAVEINVLVNDNDLDIDPTSVVIVTKPTNGIATYLGNSKVRYIPNPNYNGVDYFTYTVRDLTNLISNVARVDITINAIPDAPVSTNGWYSTPENIPVVIPISQLTSDPDNDISYSTILIENSAQFGIVSLGVNPGELVYTPNDGFAGNDSFNYSIADATGLRSNIAVISMQVSNEAPITGDDEFDINEDERSVLNVLGNDVDPQNNINPASVVIVTNPLNGIAIVSAGNGTIAYTPNADYNGTDFLIYRVCDLTGYCDEARVDLTIFPINDSPGAVDDERTLPEDNAVFIDVLTNDSDVDNLNDDLIIGFSTQPSHGNVQVVTDPDGIVYTPNLNYFGNDNFTYRISDPDGLFSEATVYLTITPVNDPPEPIDDEFELKGVAAMLLNILDNDIDPDNNINPASVTIVVSAQHGQTTVNPDGTVLYVPSSSYFGVDGFTYSVCDIDVACAEASVTLTIEAGMEMPSAFAPKDGNWKKEGIIDFDENELSVFNRWGYLVYHKKPFDINEGWDGKASAKVMGSEDLPEGTYFYILILGNKQIQKGSVYIKR